LRGIFARCINPVFVSKNNGNKEAFYRWKFGLSGFIE
jgi:hypothetical protein